MRELTSHKVNGCNEKLVIQVVGKAGPGSAAQRYDIIGFDTMNNAGAVDEHGYKTSFSRLPIVFQNGAIGDVGTNGVTHEALLAIIEDRLSAFQAGPYACEENANALAHVQAAQSILKSRTQKRLLRGVEGTMKV